MSAWLVSRNHIDAILSTATFGPKGTACAPHYYPIAYTGLSSSGHPLLKHVAGREDEIGRMLWVENVRSVMYRYPTHDHAGDMAEAEEYTASLRQERRLTAVECFKQIQCLEYQSCEHPGWETSEAKMFLDTLARDLWPAVPGYEAAPWGID